MERHTPWFQIVAIALVVIGLITLAAPEPAHAMDPQLILALASAAGAIALIVGYLIVANGREKNKAASLEGVYACREREASGPMGCGGNASPDSIAVAAAPESVPQTPMAADPRFTARVDALLAIAQSCGGGQASGPMGCGGPMGTESPRYSSSSPSAPAFSAPAVQGQ
jgi:energy-converting hydrogenase Eha subunit C